MSLGYLPWYAGGLTLAGISLAYWVLERRTMGVSGAYERLLFWRRDTNLRETELALAEDREAVEAAMLAATKAAFGDDFAAEVPSSEEAEASPAPSAPAVRPATSVHLTFLLCLIVGGAIGALLKGGWSPSKTLGADFEAFFSAGPAAWGALFGGGLLVGFGTRMAGGCTSGHGLVGCALLRPASLLSTAVFFGTGIGVSFLLEALK